jgi:hypothetical protein
MGIFTKRNALVGYFVLHGFGKYWKRAQHRRRMRALKIGALVGAGVLSLGLLAALAVLARKHQGGAAEPHQGDDVADDGTEAPAPAPGNGRVSQEPAPAA